MSSSKVARSREIDVEDTTSSDGLTTALVLSSGFIVSGEIVSTTADGQVSVDYPQNSLGPLSARTLMEDLYLGAKVLLAFDGGDPTRPIILGILHDQARTAGRTIRLKASRIVLEAEDELLLQCGEASFEARRNGRVDLKGRDVVSRATRTNKVRGSTVLVN